MLVVENVLLQNLVAFAPTYLFASGFLNAFSIKQITFSMLHSMEASIKIAK